MKTTIVARRYARALFDLSLEMKILERIKEDMETIVEICRTNRDFNQMLLSPVVNTDKKIRVFTSLFGDTFHELSIKYLIIITRKNRESYLQHIALQFIKLYKAYKHILTVDLETAARISEQARQSILNLLKEQTSGEIELNEHIDEDLIGGFILKYENKKYDASISKQLFEMKKSLADVNLYISEL